MKVQGVLAPVVAIMALVVPWDNVTAPDGDAGRPSISDYGFAPFGTVSVYRPATDPSGVVLLLSDADGVGARETAIADTIARRGLMVALVSTPELMRQADAGRARCLDFNYPLIDLSDDVQHRMTLKSHSKPIILGLGDGGALAYASLSQWPNASYQGVVSVDFRPRLSAHKSWCATPGFMARRGKDAVWELGANPRIRLPWLVLQPAGAKARDDSGLRAFTAAIAQARPRVIPQDPDGWMEPVARAVTGLAPHPLRVAGTGALPLPDMPLTLVPARPGAANNDVMAIIYSGDGGWVGIDRDVAGQLADAGIPVVGVDSLSYFWNARTPAGASRDLAALIAGFTRYWKRPHVLMVGYSFGADVLPIMVDGLDPAIRAHVIRVALLGFSDTADFQFHLSSWLNVSSDSAIPTMPAVERLRGLPIQCIRGEQEDDSACKAIPAGIAQQYLVPGDHHFDRNAALLADIILQRRRPGTVAD